MRTIDKRIAPNVRLAATLVARAPALTLAYDARCKRPRAAPRRRRRNSAAAPRSLLGLLV